MYVLHIFLKICYQGIEMSNFLVKSNFIKCQSKNKSPVQPLRYWLAQTKVNAMEPQTTISQGRKVIFANLELNEYLCKNFFNETPRISSKYSLAVLSLKSQF